jgi:hypothetical protein
VSREHKIITTKMALAAQIETKPLFGDIISAELVQNPRYTEISRIFAEIQGSKSSRDPEETVSIVISHTTEQNSMQAYVGQEIQEIAQNTIAVTAPLTFMEKNNPTHADYVVTFPIRQKRTAFVRTDEGIQVQPEDSFLVPPNIDMIISLENGGLQHLLCQTMQVDRDGNIEYIDGSAVPAVMKYFMGVFDALTYHGALVVDASESNPYSTYNLLTALFSHPELHEFRNKILRNPSSTLHSLQEFLYVHDESFVKLQGEGENRVAVITQNTALKPQKSDDTTN